ncbi:CheR family methyltransferase [Megalodesulfovibrio gigas]|uniref:protein-glutamate O-methyltransferase n=1 Tax=Megalodesulfovibrio gigas (strain ATCC 19364 / DSM 1382 / NCIMB 9332 / VKM B-1759) TaxID=1121448 RepID=T2GG09_MEGG1|nr:CheR family methyltransferase [Megalodesulfovibrio gigas]AGW15149.1 putative chemotaxis protein methyltransferase [Megalodesulfovibrio gigas DSM 1382 = ATCC 19364]
MGLLNDAEFNRLASFIYREVGIKMPPGKKTMLEARLLKRLRILKLPDYKSYCDYLFSPAGMTAELHQLIDVVTTNTTDFFREPKHFELLQQNLLPHLANGPCRGRTLRVWSAGCSIGMEPYTLAMVLAEFRERTPGFRFSILATDISTQALEKARAAVYDEERVAPVPKHLKFKYLLRSKDRSRGLVRVVPELRQLVTFQRLNFMEEFSFPDPMDIIFCRNVIIYFDRPTQEVLFQKFCRCLRGGGFLFIGHSESITGMDLPLNQVAPTVYSRHATRRADG